MQNALRLEGGWASPTKTMRSPFSLGSFHKTSDRARSRLAQYQPAIHIHMIEIERFRAGISSNIPFQAWPSGNSPRYRLPLPFPAKPPLTEGCLSSAHYPFSYSHASLPIILSKRAVVSPIPYRKFRGYQRYPYLRAGCRSIQ